MVHPIAISTSTGNTPTATAKLHVYFTIAVCGFSMSDSHHPPHPIDSCLLLFAIAASNDRSSLASPFAPTD
jgi:hypothetical protein